MKNVNLFKKLIILVIVSAFLLPSCFAGEMTEIDEIKMVVKIMHDVKEYTSKQVSTRKIEDHKRIVDHIGYEILMRKYNLKPEQFFIAAVGMPMTLQLEYIFVRLEMNYSNYSFRCSIKKAINNETNSI